MRLIPFTSDHFTTLATWFTDEAAIVLWGGPLLHYPLDESQMNSMLEESTCTPPRRLCWMAKHNNQWAGHVQLAFDWRNGNATLGRVVINPALRGQRLANPMIKLAMAQAFAYPQIFRLELNVYTFNQPAINAYIRLGFVNEGTRRLSTLVGNARWDTAIMAILQPDYHKIGH